MDLSETQRQTGSKIFSEPLWAGLSLRNMSDVFGWLAGAVKMAAWLATRHNSRT